jgi:cytochrome c oxidase subunit 2
MGTLFFILQPAHGAEVDNLMNITWVLIFIVQAITQVLLHYFAFKYRGKRIKSAC